MIASLTIWDIDDTLFHTTASVYVMREERTISKLSPAEFNVYKLKDGEKFDFREFKSASHFAATARPIKNVFTTAKKMMNRLTGSNNKFIIVTARSDMDDKNLFVDTFRKYGFDIDRSYIHRAGNIDKPGFAAKKQIIDSEMKKASYDIVRMFDDSRKNLTVFLELKREYPNTKFEAYFIGSERSISRLN